MSDTLGWFAVRGHREGAIHAAASPFDLQKTDRAGGWVRVLLGADSSEVYDAARKTSEALREPAFAFLAIGGRWGWQLFDSGRFVAGMDFLEGLRPRLDGDVRGAAELLEIDAAVLRRYAEAADDVKAFPDDKFKRGNPRAHGDLARRLGFGAGSMAAPDRSQRKVRYDDAIDWTRAWHPVLVLPMGYDVLDLSVPESQRAPRRSTFSVGRYDEERPTMYDHPLFGGERFLHVGMDLGGPSGSAVHAFWSGRIESIQDHKNPGDYGPTIVTRHELDGTTLFALHGHLASGSLYLWEVGQNVERGQVLGWLGETEENGGWPPHVHFQLSFRAPMNGDLPGVVDPAVRDQALLEFPDPRRVLGQLY